MKFLSTSLVTLLIMVVHGATSAEILEPAGSSGALDKRSSGTPAYSGAFGSSDSDVAFNPRKPRLSFQVSQLHFCYKSSSSSTCLSLTEDCSC
ncbi:hypothetical protein PCANC_07558 [Puccinia coronata f. sp. avenae]|uniref:Uncharacterized protein n=1 Tax=Puccinia coronata f. sp. avenae TaxID=200324 RepID=A0A2N5VSH6_9BASI|nr:hypothetical protein PCANC_07558 [Puccinia coronata f. sp. avenae]